MRLCKTGAKLKFLNTGSSVNNNERNDRLAITVGNYKVGVGKTTLLPGDCHALTSCYEISRPGRSGIREYAKKNVSRSGSFTQDLGAHIGTCIWKNLMTFEEKENNSGSS